MKPLLTAFLAVFYVVTWKEWEARNVEPCDRIGCAVIHSLSSDPYMAEASRREEFTDEGRKPNTPLAEYRAKKKAAELRAEPHRYWDVKLKLVEETEVKR